MREQAAKAFKAFSFAQNTDREMGLRVVQDIFRGCMVIAAVQAVPGVLVMHGAIWDALILAASRATEPRCRVER